MKVTVYLNTHKTASNGQHPVWIRLAKKDELKYVSVGATLPKDCWDSKKNWFKGDELPYTDVIDKINKKKKQINDKLKELGDEMEIISLNTFIEKLDKNNPKRRDIFVYKYFDEVCERLKNSGKYGNYKVYKNLLNKLKGTKDKKGNRLSEGFRKADFLFSEIDVTFLRNFESFLYKGHTDRQKRQGSINIHMRTIRRVYNLAIGEDPTLLKYYPFSKYKDEPGKYSIPEGNDAHGALESLEIKKLMELDIDSDHYRYTKFIYYAGGISWIDFCYLKWTNIISNGETLKYQRKKLESGGKDKGVVNIPLHPEVKKILSFYKPRTGINPDNYIFPILNITNETATSRDNKIRKILKVYNSELRNYGSLAGIQTSLTSYRLRHTFFTELARNNQPFYIIKTFGAHVNDSTTMKYLEKANPEEMKRALNSL
jgi:integrase